MLLLFRRLLTHRRKRMIMGSSDIEEFQQRLWKSWRHQDLTYLSGEKEGNIWEFVDDHYYPFYGVGNPDAEVMIVGSAPAWNVGEGSQLPDKRDKHWSCNDLEWAPDVDRDSFERQEKIWRLNRLKERKNLVQTMSKLVKFSSVLKLGELNGVEDPFQDLYYTNFQKDGEFGDRNLDRMSQVFWEDYLEREIKLQDPSVILPIGTTSSEVVTEICGQELSFKPLRASGDGKPIVVQSSVFS